MEWKTAGMQDSRHAGQQAWKTAGMEDSRYGRQQAWKTAGMQDIVDYLNVQGYVT